MRTIKDLCEQLASDDNMLREKMSELLSLRRIVAIEEIRREARSGRPRAFAENEAAAPQL
jgi:hypothetical protein